MAPSRFTFFAFLAVTRKVIGSPALTVMIGCFCPGILYRLSWFARMSMTRPAGSRLCPRAQMPKSPASIRARPASCRPHWNNEPIGEAQRPHVQVARAAELPAIIACGFQSIDKVVVQPEFELLCIYRRQRITDQVPSEKLLVPRHELRPAHLVLQKRKLAQLVSGLNPVAASSF